jgi:two-component system chemotaxis sensor kinase CheA
MNSLSTLEERTVSDLAEIRSSILLFLQDPTSAFDLRPALEKLCELEGSAASADGGVPAQLTSECRRLLESICLAGHAESGPVLKRVLDHLAKIEAHLIGSELDSGLFENVSDFVDRSFEHLTGESEAEAPGDDSSFQIDDETLEIFRAEASDLLASISSNLDQLAYQPGNRNAMWEMRRAVHTLKGAAGIVGLTDASRLSHRIEDLLGLLVENDLETTSGMVDALNSCVSYFGDMTQGGNCDGDPDQIERALNTLIEETASRIAKPKVKAAEGGDKTVPARSDVAKPAPPIVRVALDRLHAIHDIAAELAVSRTRAAEVFDNILHGLEIPDGNSPGAAELQAIFADQHRLCSDLLERIEEIRMVRFGTLVTRLSRAVNVTCQEEDKKAEVIVENDDIELDTQIIDSLVEPLLHLLRNAVVHGIESPETRRMIAKPEKGRIVVRVDKTGAGITVSVTDNGRGVDPSKLKEKALKAGSISPQLAESMTDEEAMELMFLRGVTTADALSMNAGRGIGMCIVKQSIEDRGGRLTIVTQPNKGTTFTITFPAVTGARVGQTIQTVHVSGVSEVIDHAEPAGEADGLQNTAEASDADDLANDAETETNTPAAEDIAPDECDVSAVKRSHTPSSISVLIIDDSPLMRASVTKLIERAGWRATTATDGREALERLRKPGDQPDVILTDLEMPNLDGMGLLRDLKRDPRLCSIPVIMITSRSERVHRQKAVSLGAAGFFTKPLDGSDLRSAISQICELTSAEAGWA